MEKLVTRQSDFLRLHAEVASVVDWGKRLPEFVFCRPYDRYIVIEYGYVTRPDFGSFLYSLAMAYENQSVNYMTIEPDPVDFYFANHEFYGAASFMPSELPEKYIPTMQRGQNAASFFHRGGDLGVFWGSSLKWAVYCDRISFELAIIACPGDFDISKHGNFRILNPETLRSYMFSQYSWKPSKAEVFMTNFLRNYGI